MLRGLAAAFALLLCLAPALAQKPESTGPAPDNGAPASTERIHSFHSDIVVEPSGDLIVTETITLTALGREIRRGPYRDFPTRYRNNFGDQVEVGFTVLDVQRDGRTEPYHTERISNGVRVYIGDADYFLPQGRYTYTLRYRTTRQLYFGRGNDDFDSLYFNITGNGWDFTIDEASALVHLPQGAEALEIEFFTGAQGSTATNASVDDSTPGQVRFQTTRALGPREGLTIAVSFPKGFVEPPSATEQATSWVQDNAPGMLGIIAFLLSFAYYYQSWNSVGRDPTPGTIIPLFEPPTGFSPAATRFVSKMQFDQSAFTAAIISMAVKGYLTIKESGKTFVLEKASGDVSVLSMGEAAIAEELLRTRSSIKLKNTNYEKFQKAVSGLKSELRKEFEAVNFKRNQDYMVPGVLIALVAVLLTGLIKFDIIAALAGTALCLIFGSLIGTLASFGYRYIEDRASIGRWFLAILMAIGGVMIAAMAIFVSFQIPGGYGFAAAVLFLATGALTPVFADLMKAPTKAGREVMDQIEGFKKYLSVAERHRLEAFHPPKQTPELFEKYLPYALALGVENQWSEQFDDILKAASAGTNGGYQPSWYHGTRWGRIGAAGFVGSLGSAMTSSVASAATAPGSSSGVGGGGFSGGGGGGGGGGGW